MRTYVRTSSVPDRYRCCSTEGPIPPQAPKLPAPAAASTATSRTWPLTRSMPTCSSSSRGTALSPRGSHWPSGTSPSGRPAGGGAPRRCSAARPGRGGRSRSELTGGQASGHEPQPPPRPPTPSGHEPQPPPPPPPRRRPPPRLGCEPRRGPGRGGGHEPPCLAISRLWPRAPEPPAAPAEASCSRHVRGWAPFLRPRAPRPPATLAGRRRRMRLTSGSAMTVSTRWPAS